MTKSEQLMQRAVKSIPGGVNSPVRAWSSIGECPRFVHDATGSTLTDVDGHKYIDYVGSWGPMILGHAYPPIVDAVCNAAKLGTSFGAPTQAEVTIAEELCHRVPCVERVRLVNSGTEATMSALRLARAATGRDAIVKFAGCYHGHADGLLVRAGSGATTFGVPDSPGVPEAIGALTRVARFNDLDSVRAVLDQEVAAIIVEPVAGNMGVVPPDEGFLQGLRDLTREAGALLIFDEVMTGLRLARGGYQEVAGVIPDLVCLGKVVGGGLPVGAYGGRGDLMDQISPAGPVYQAGTLSGNPLATAAGLATLRGLDEPGVYERLEQVGAALEKGLRAALGGHPGCVQRVGSMITLFFGPSRVRNYDDALACDTNTFATFFRAMVERGVWLPPSQFEAWFLSAAHSDEDIARTVAAAGEAIAVACD
ncbi:MAG: glutamate-1-semialdehyde 2,1-aminomutase [Hyphomicrobiaceae bacterium]